MSEEFLKLTTYFGERQRVGGRLVADELLDLYGRERLAASIMLRGTEGFGLRHHLRTDASLTLSEDLPAVAIAVDASERIRSIAEQAARWCGSGMITLERARLHAGELPGLDPLGKPHEATKLTVYFGRRERVAGLPASAALCALLRRRGLSGATALLGVDGTAFGRRQRARFFGRNADVPVMMIAVGPGERVAAVLPEVGQMLSRPLVTLERLRICKMDGELYERPHAFPASDEDGRPLWQKLMIHTSEAQLHARRPIHRIITERLREAGVAGSTTLRGVWGFHGDHEPHGDRVLQFGRQVPAVTVLVDTPEGIARSFDVVDEITSEHGLVTSEMVPAMLVRSGGHGRGGLELARHRY